MRVSRRGFSTKPGRSRSKRKAFLAALAFLWLVVTLPAGACGGGGNDKSESPNLLTNPGFEKGADPWYSMESSGWGTPFDVSDSVAHSGGTQRPLGATAAGRAGPTPGIRRGAKP